MNTLSEILNSLIRFGIFLVIISIPIIIFICLGSLVVTFLTLIYSLFKEESYHFICDQSEVLYKINNLGVLTGSVLALFLSGLLLFKLFL